MKRFAYPYVGHDPTQAPTLTNLEILMNRFRLPLATFVLLLVAACQSAPTAPAADPQAPAATARFGVDSVVTEAARGGSIIGSGN